MEPYVWLLLIGLGGYALKTSEQRQRIALLGAHLRPFQLEKLIETLTDGYLRAMGEKDAQRRGQIWELLSGTETALADQLNRLALAFAQEEAAMTRVSRLPLALPLAHRLLPDATFDLRKLLGIHAHGVAQVVANSENLSPRDKAFRLSAELFLFQHTCHWYCRSKAVASARLLARHKTAYEQVLTAVSAETRLAYGALVNG